MIRVRKNCDELIMEWRDIIAQTRVSGWNGKTYTEYVPAGADNILINPDGTCIIRVVDLRVLIDNLRNGGVDLSFEKIKVEPAHYLNEIQGFNSIVLYRGWYCRVDSCGGVVLCTEQEAYKRGYIR